MQFKNIHITKHSKEMIRGICGATVLTLFAMSIAAVVVLKTKELAFEAATPADGVYGALRPEPFPVSVDPTNKTIVERPDVHAYHRLHLSGKSARSKEVGFLDRAVAKLAHLEWYQNLASPISRILVVLPGERKEEVAQNFADILRWSHEEKEAFVAQIESAQPKLPEGTFFPGKYMVNADASPQDVANILSDRFRNEVLLRYTDEVASRVPLEDTLILASLLEREAYDFEDMRHIAGVIWNRLFIDMHLQIDASLQYAKGTASQYAWWPRVYPKDKFIDSPFNTYEHKGLPPSPISNPSLEAMLATLNPTNTECMYYFHDSNGAFHCAQTYEEHVALLKKHYGRGK